VTAGCCLAIRLSWEHVRDAALWPVKNPKPKPQTEQDCGLGLDRSFKEPRIACVKSFVVDGVVERPLY